MNKLVVFGATSAISQAYVKRVATDCSSIVLVARNAEYLEQIADHLRVVCTATVTTFIADLADTDSHAALVRRTCEGNTDCVLVCYGALTDQQRCLTDTNYAMQQLVLNGLSTISLSAQIADVMARNNSGTLAVVASVAGDRGRKSNYYYGAAKSAVTTFLSGLRVEMAAKGVEVLTIKPGFVDTPMTSEYKKGILWSTAARVAQDIDRAVKAKKGVLYTPWFWRYIILVIRMLPDFIFKRLSI